MSLPIVLKTRRPFLAVHSLIVNQQRSNTRESIHRYVEPNKFKKHMLSASEPYFKRKYILPEESCKGIAPPEREMHPLNQILVKELVEELKKSELVLFVQYNYIEVIYERKYKNNVIKAGGNFVEMNNEVKKEAFKIIGCEQINSLFIGRNALITGQADCLARCVNALKKMPQFILLAGLIDNRVYEFDELKLISAYPNLDQTRANLLNILTTPASELYSYLERHQDNIKESGGDESGQDNKTDNN